MRRGRVVESQRLIPLRGGSSEASSAPWVGGSKCKLFLGAVAVCFAACAMLALLTVAGPRHDDPVPASASDSIDFAYTRCGVTYTITHRVPQDDAHVLSGGMTFQVTEKSYGVFIRDFTVSVEVGRPGLHANHIHEVDEEHQIQSITLPDGQETALRFSIWEDENLQESKHYDLNLVFYDIGLNGKSGEYIITDEDSYVGGDCGVDEQHLANGKVKLVGWHGESEDVESTEEIVGDTVHCEWHTVHLSFRKKSELVVLIGTTHAFTENITDSPRRNIGFAFSDPRLKTDLCKNIKAPTQTMTTTATTTTITSTTMTTMTTTPHNKTLGEDIVGPISEAIGTFVEGLINSPGKILEQIEKISDKVGRQYIIALVWIVTEVVLQLIRVTGVMEAFKKCRTYVMEAFQKSQAPAPTEETAQAGEAAAGRTGEGRSSRVVRLIPAGDGGLDEGEAVSETKPFLVDKEA